MHMIQSSPIVPIKENDFFLFANHSDWAKWWYLNSLTL